MSQNLIFYKFVRRRFLSVKSRLLYMFLFICVFVIVYRYILSFSRAKVITLQEIPHYLVPSLPSSQLNEGKQLCDLMPILTNGSWPLTNLNITDNNLESLASRLNIQPGGYWKPNSCVSQHHVALIIPYRDRQAQLNIFLAHMHQFLHVQCLNYRIFIIEQTEQRPFNRAKLFNVGFAEAEKITPFHCYIFHDVDLLPLNIHNIYGCTKLPRHLSANIDIFDYKVPYDWIFGGAISMLRSQFLQVNGFSNKFFGWGGEDDDFFNRVTKNGTTICRFEPEISKYTMLSHKKETPNEDRFYYLTTGVRRFETDGLNSLKYSVKKLELKPLYTNIIVDI